MCWFRESCGIINKNPPNIKHPVNDVEHFSSSFLAVTGMEFCLLLLMIWTFTGSTSAEPDQYSRAVVSTKYSRHTKIPLWVVNVYRQLCGFLWCIWKWGGKCRVCVTFASVFFCILLNPIYHIHIILIWHLMCTLSEIVFPRVFSFQMVKLTTHGKGCVCVSWRGV